MPRARTKVISWAVLMAFFIGFTTGNLPDEGPIWAGIKALASVAAFVLAVRLARREAGR